jgi:hypothetical protein
MDDIVMTYLKMFYVLYRPEWKYIVHKSPPLACILSQMNSDHTFLL